MDIYERLEVVFSERRGEW